MVARIALTALFVMTLTGLGTAPASADRVVVNGTSVSASESNGEFTAEISLLNIGPRDVTLPGSVALTDSCVAKVSDRTIGGLSSGQVTLTFDETCFGDAESVEADVDAGGPLPPVTIKKPDDEHDWSPMGTSAAIALVASTIIGLIGVAMVSKIDGKRKARTHPASGEGVKRQVAYEKLKDHVNARVAELSGDPLPWMDNLPTAEDYTLTSEVRGLQAGWSFKDSWAANLSVATTALVALINSADTLTAVLGEKPEAALGVMTVAGLISATVIAIANTIAKLVGDTTSVVTTGGLILSTSLVVFAAALQTGTVGGTALTLVSGGPARFWVLVLTIAVGLVLIWYALATLYSTLSAGAVDAPLPVIPTDAFETWAASHDWEREVVKERIRTTYADWLTTPSPAATIDYPMLAQTLTTSRGDETYWPTRASLI